MGRQNRQRSTCCRNKGSSKAYAVDSFTTSLKLQKGIRELLDTTVMACAPCIKASLCARAFETHYPRLTLTSATELDWQEGEQAILSVLVSHRNHRM